mmetsp:Transcript_65269/g.204518  ORF Transcript_65269/g.204518 Transcript_65269/m.204518 type:complete len:257 (-) Transcript_65269:53-823(-)
MGLTLCPTSAHQTSSGGMEDAGVEEKMRSVHWVPLESNPEMLTEFARKVGLPEPWQFVDVFGTDPDLLAMVPPTCAAVTLLFRTSDATRNFKQEQRIRLEASGQTLNPELVYLKQYVGNACGTIACIHSLTNNAEVMGIDSASPIGKFFESIRGKTPKEAGSLLADASDLHQASEASAAGGQTAAPEATADVDAHFIAFVEKGGDIYELDGAKAFPINHGPTGGKLLEAAAKVIKAAFMDTDPDSIHFNMMALVKQ